MSNTYDFDPSGDEHPDYCMCPCCELDDHCDDEEDEIDGYDN